MLAENQHRSRWTNVVVYLQEDHNGVYLKEVTANVSRNWTHAKMLDVQVIDNDQEDFVQIFADYLCDFSNKDTRKYIKSVESLWPAGPPEQYKQLIRDVLY